MALRCVLFSSDPGTVEPITQALADLGVEGEHCPEAVAAVEKVCREAFQIVIVDWDKQPEAGALLAATRERKLAERPLTVAIVSNDAEGSKAMQVGANSILRKPVLAKQVTDSLSRARDLLRAREAAAQAAAAGVGTGTASPTVSGSRLPAKEATLRAGEFLQSSAPATQIDTESEMQKSLQQSAAQDVEALDELEPMASAVVQAKPETPPPPPAYEEPRGLQWYLNQRAAATPAPTPAAAPSPSKPELLGFNQISMPPPAKSVDAPQAAQAEPKETEPKEKEKQAAAALFAYIAEGQEPAEDDRPRMRLGKGPILFALALAACAIVAAPQAPWNPQLRKLWAHGKQVTHAWLNPQPVTPAQAPVSHENFGRAGDEYKLPVAENIPDATTDPSQIRVTPMVDPTAKKPNNGANTDPNLAPADAAATNASDPAQGSATTTQTPGNQTPAPNPGSSPDNTSNNQVPQAALPSTTVPPTTTQPNVTGASGTAAPPSNTTNSTSGPATEPTPSSAAAAATQPASPKSPLPRPAASSAGPSIPSSLKSQMASMTPDASGNKAAEAALPSIEPVVVPEAAERALATDQSVPAYPETAKGQQGTVVLQVLIGRDGAVQDAKFLQGSLAFARNAIDSVKQWKFKPYMMNGRPVSVQTNLTIAFKPAQ
jgi:periplasmic protein TonB